MTAQGIDKDLTRIFELFPRLDERQSQKAGTMSGGEQQMLAIGRALMGDPKVLLLDEPSMGISPVLTERIYETIAEINQRGHDDPAGRAERELRARRLQARVRARDRQGRRCPTARTRCGPTPKSRRRTSEHEHARAHRRRTALARTVAASAIAGYLSDRKGYGDKPGWPPACACRSSRIVWLSCRPSRSRSGRRRPVRAPQKAAAGRVSGRPAAADRSTQAS